MTARPALALAVALLAALPALARAQAVAGTVVSGGLKATVGLRVARLCLYSRSEFGFWLE